MQIILGERRSDRRYTVQLNLRYKVLKGSHVLSEGSGITCEMSRGGLSFRPDRILPPGAPIEMSIDWPILLHGQHPLSLHIMGRVVRTMGGQAAVKTTWHEFVRLDQPEEFTIESARENMEDAVMVI